MLLMLLMPLMLLMDYWSMRLLFCQRSVLEVKDISRELKKIKEKWKIDESLSKWKKIEENWKEKAWRWQKVKIRLKWAFSVWRWKLRWYLLVISISMLDLGVPSQHSWKPINYWNVSQSASKSSQTSPKTP